MSHDFRQLLATSAIGKHLSECKRTNSKSGQGIVIHPLRVERKSPLEKHFLYRWWEIQLHRQAWLRATLSDFGDVQRDTKGKSMTLREAINAAYRPLGWLMSCWNMKMTKPQHHVSFMFCWSLVHNNRQTRN